MWAALGGEGPGPGRLQCMLPSTSVGRVGPPCCSLEGEESGPGPRSSKARQALRARACGFPPASVRVLGCGGGAVGAGAEAVPPAGNPEEPEHPGCGKLLASRRGDGAPWPVIPQLDEPPREAAGVGPTGSWGKRVKFSSPNPPTVDVAGGPRRPREAQRNQLQVRRLCMGWGWWEGGGWVLTGSAARGGGSGQLLGRSTLRGG